MADENKPAELTKTPEPIKPYVFDEAAFKTKITKLEQSIQDKAGKPNYNPFVWEQESGLQDMINKFKLGVRSKELFDLVAALPDEVPCIDKNYKPEAPYTAPLPIGLRPATKK